MKLFVAVALFAFLAVQLSHSAPVPDEEKKDEAPAAEQRVASDAPAAAPAAPEVKVEATAKSADPVAPAAAAAAAPAAAPAAVSKTAAEPSVPEEKKEAS